MMKIHMDFPKIHVDFAKNPYEFPSWESNKIHMDTNIIHIEIYMEIHVQNTNIDLVSYFRVY